MAKKIIQGDVEIKDSLKMGNSEINVDSQNENLVINNNGNKVIIAKNNSSVQYVPVGDSPFDSTQTYYLLDGDTYINVAEEYGELTEDDYDALREDLYILQIDENIISFPQKSGTVALDSDLADKQDKISVIELSSASGTLTQEQFTELSKDIAIIKYNNKIFYKEENDTTNGALIFTSKISSSTISNSYVQLSQDMISINTTSLAYTYTANAIVNTYNKTQIDTLLNDKQPTLISGTNIKTINNTSLLGAGNINAGTKVADGFGTNWSSKTWEGLSDFYGDMIWTDGENIYYSSSSNQYVLNKATNTWVAKTWDGYPTPSGSSIWTDGENIYYSSSSTQKVLNKTTNAWETKTWIGLTSFNGDKIWTDGENIYYSYQTTQYVLNKSTSTWETKTWINLTNFNGSNVWSDGENIYYSSGSTQYILNKTNSTWTTKTWTNLTSFEGQHVWSDGVNIFYSNYDKQYVLNKANSTWTRVVWTGTNDFEGARIWNDGKNIYFSLMTTQYQLDKVYRTIEVVSKVAETGNYNDLEGKPQEQHLYRHEISFVGQNLNDDDIMIKFSFLSTNNVVCNTKSLLLQNCATGNYNAINYYDNPIVWASQNRILLYIQILSNEINVALSNNGGYYDAFDIIESIFENQTFELRDEITTIF